MKIDLERRLPQLPPMQIDKNGRMKLGIKKRGKPILHKNGPSDTDFYFPPKLPKRLKENLKYLGMTYADEESASQAQPDTSPTGAAVNPEVLQPSMVGPMVSAFLQEGEALLGGGKKR